MTDKRKPGGVRTYATRIATTDTRAVKPPPKTVDAELNTPAHRQWRDRVLQRAGYRCEWIDKGQRCPRKAPGDRMFADHRIERRDGGDPLDVANGRCLCGRHHSVKTAAARVARLRA